MASGASITVLISVFVLLKLLHPEIAAGRSLSTQMGRGVVQ